MPKQMTTWIVGPVASWLVAATSFACGVAPPPASKDAGTPPDAAPADAGSEQEQDAGPSGEDGSPISTEPRPCTVGSSQCFSNQICAPIACGGQGRCEFVTDLCKTSGALGPVCGCDGQIYEKACDAYMAGVGIAKPSACLPPDKHVACDSEFCDTSREYCCYFPVVTAAPRSCLSLPDACLNQTTPDCTCFGDASALCRILSGPTPSLEFMCPPPPPE